MVGRPAAQVRTTTSFERGLPIAVIIFITAFRFSRSSRTEVRRTLCIIEVGLQSRKRLPWEFIVGGAGILCLCPEYRDPFPITLHGRGENGDS